MADRIVKKIEIEIIEHKRQRYPTVGDYWHEPDGKWQLRISSMPDWRYVILVALHELIEMSLSYHRGISEGDISEFDIIFEQERAQGRHKKNDEPGNDPRAPYRKEHEFATGIERQVAEQLGVDWNSYDDTVVKL